MKKITVIIPVFNSAIFIEQCLLSIINQSYKNIEIIVINDGSTDNSLEIINKMNELDDRILILNQENQGVSVARNNGLKHSTGDYVGFIDSDDFIENTMYEKMLVSALEYNADIVECNYKRIDINNNNIGNGDLKFSLTRGNYDILKGYLKEENTSNVNWNKLYSKEVINGIFYPQFKYSEDYYFNVMTFLNCNIKVTIPDQLYTQISHEMSAVNQIFSDKKMDIIKSGLSVKEIIEDIYPDLSIYASLYILGNIISLSEQIKKSVNINREIYLEKLIKLYNPLFDLFNKEIFKSYLPYKKKIFLYLFRINPNISNHIEAIRIKKN